MPAPRYEVINPQGTVSLREYTLAAALSTAYAMKGVVHDTKTGKIQCRDCGRFTCNC